MTSIKWYGVNGVAFNDGEVAERTRVVQLIAELIVRYADVEQDDDDPDGCPTSYMMGAIAALDELRAKVEGDKNV